MKDAITYLETGSVDPRYNLAFEEYVLRSRRTGTYLLLWQNEHTVVIGQNQNAEAEINRSFVEEHHIQVVRRSTGGGAVYHDLGNLNYSFITDAEGGERLALERFTVPIVHALQALGLQAEASGRNDILVEGKKVSGTAQRMMQGRVLHHGTLLFDSDPAMIAGALQVDPEKYRSKSTPSVRSRVGNIRGFLKQDLDLTAFWAFLKDFLAGEGLVTDVLTPEEQAAVDALRQSKYDTWAWNFGASPPYDTVHRRRWDGGSLEVRLSVAEGAITHITFYGDFLSLRPLDDLAAALRGCPFRRADFSRVLDRFPLAAYFGGIRQAEILDTIF